METRQLRHLIALAEEGRFARAAERVHLSQAAFSRSIQALERSLGLQLFERRPKGAVPTAAGKVVLARARQLVFDGECFKRDLALMRGGELGELSFGAGPVPAATLAPELLARLTRTCPGVVIRMRSGNLASFMDLLHAEAIDFFMADYRLMQADARLQLRPLAPIHGGVYCRTGHVLARARRPVTLEDLRRNGLALTTTSPELRSQIARALGFGPGEPLPVSLECDDLHTLMRLARDGDILAMLPHAMARSAGKELSALAVKGARGPVFADVHAFWLRGRSLSPAAARAIELAAELAKGLSSRGAA